MARWSRQFRCQCFIFISADLRSISTVRKMHICVQVTFGRPRVNNGLQSFCIFDSERGFQPLCSSSVWMFLCHCTHLSPKTWHGVHNQSILFHFNICECQTLLRNFVSYTKGSISFCDTSLTTLST